MQYNNNSEHDFLNRTIIKAAQILLLVMSPGLFSSIYREVFVDGAFVVVAVQTCLYLLLILVSIPKTPIDYKSRVISVASIIIIIGLGGLVRNQSLVTGFVYIWFGFIFLSVILTGATRYVLPTVGYISVFIYAVSAGIETIDVGLSRFLAFVGVSWGAIYFLSSILNRTASQRDEFARLVEELSDTQAKLKASLLENQFRQKQIDQVALHANIAFFKFDFETGLLHPDLALAKRYGRDDLEPFNFIDYKDQFGSDDIQVLSDQIAMGAQQSEGWSTEFIHKQRVSSGEWITLKGVGINVLQGSKVIFMGASIDITAEVEANKNAKRQLTYLNLLAEAGKIGLVTYYPSQGMLKLNSEFSRRMGVDVTDKLIPVAQYNQHLDPAWLEYRAQKTAEFVKLPLGSVQVFEEQFIQNSGEKLSFKVARIRYHEDGEDIVLGVSIDITDEMEALKHASELSAQIELVSTAGGVGLIEFFPDTRTFKCNPEVSERLGVEHTESERDIELFYAHQTEEIRAQFLTPRRLLAESDNGELQSFVHPFYLANGELHYMRVSRVKREADGRTSFLGLSLDITDEVQAKEQAEKQAEQLKLITEQGKIGLYEFDLEKGVIYANSVLCERFGVDPEVGVITQQQLMDRLTEGAREAALAQIEAGKTQPEGYFSTSIVEEASSDGKVRKIRIFEKIERREGHPFYVGASVDVTEEVEAKEQAEQQADQLRQANEENKFRKDYLESMLDAAPVPVLLLEGNMESRWFTYVNQETLRVLGYTKEEMLGKNATEMMFLNDEDRRYYVSKVVESMQSGTPLKEEMQLYRKNKVVGNFEFNCTYKMVGEKLFGTLFVLDIDERKAKEQQLIEAVQNSQQATEKLQQEQDRQAQMYAVIGHELRTPTASLKMILDDAQQGSGQINTALFSSTIDQLLGVIDTLRTVAQPEKMGQASVNSVVLADLLNDQLQILTPIAKQSGVTLKGDFDSLTSDRIDLKAQLLKQLVSNLTKNAIIHSKGSEVRIEADAVVNDGVESVTLVIADNGVGIPADQIENLFSAFSRGSSDAEGTGLGLYVCREIASALGGELTYEPRLEGGSRFVLRFDAKLSKLATDTDTDTDTDTEALRGLTVLLAEDNPTIQMLTKRMLEQRGAHLVVANNGEEALLKAKEQSFDLILSDIFMPKMNGYKLVESIREQGMQTPVIGLTAATIGEETDKMLAAGANAVLSKPVNIQELTKLVASFNQ